MTAKVFAEYKSFKLIGDSRDIAVDFNRRNAVWDWCEDNDIDLEYQGSLGSIDLWRVRDEEQRLMFVLRWS